MPGAPELQEAISKAVIAAAKQAEQNPGPSNAETVRRLAEAWAWTVRADQPHGGNSSD